MKNSSTRKQNKVNSAIFAFILFTFAFYLVRCNTTEPPPVITPQPKPAGITLKLITKSSTEIFLTVSAKDTLLPAPVTIKRDNTEIMSFYLTKADTTIIDTRLAAGKTYSYKPMVKINGKEKAGDTLFATTLDTTSSSFTWQTFTFGEHSSSSLSDVAIISENDIWAVGAIYMNDSTGNADPNAYNAVHWDGNEWKLKRIFYYGDCSAVKYPPLKAIMAFSKNNIAITNGGSIGWFNGNTINLDCGINPLLNGAINKIWGTSNNNVYVVGSNGSIAHYNGTSWTKIESGTNLNINDIWGNYDEVADEQDIITVGGNILQGTERVILQITGDEHVQKINPTGTEVYPFGSVWFSSKLKYFVGGAGLYTKYCDKNIWTQIDMPYNYIYSIRGNWMNDIVVCGGLGYVGHFNGKTWKNYLGNELEQINGNYYSIAIKGNQVCTVGATANGKAVVLIGIR